MPVVAVGKLGYPDLAEKALIDEKCDMVMLGSLSLQTLIGAIKRMLKDWKYYVYRVPRSFINEFVEGGHPQCSQPKDIFWTRISAEIPKADKVKVVVIGGGPAGIVASKF